MASEWYYSRDGQEEGPVSSTELKGLASTGRLLRTDRLWKEGMAEWRLAGEFRQLFPDEEPATIVVSPEREEVVDVVPAITINTRTRSRLRKDDLPTAATVVSTAKTTARKATASLKSAGSLITKKAERTKITTITLPAAYAELGKAVFKDGSRRVEFGELFDAANDLLARRKRIHEEAKTRPAGSGLADKARKVAADATALARTKAIDLEAYRAFTRLGEAVYERHGGDSGPTAVVEPIAVAIARRDLLEREIKEMGSAAATTRRPKAGTTTWLKVGGLAFVSLWVIGSCVGGKDDGGGRSSKGGSTIRPVASDLPRDPEMRDAYESGWERGAEQGNEWLSAMREHAEGQSLQKYAQEHSWVVRKKDGVLARPIESIKTNQQTLAGLVQENAEPFLIKAVEARIHEARGYHDGFKAVSEAGLKGKDTSNPTTKRTDTTTLTVAEAQRLIQRDSWLVIKNPTTITNEVAKVLAQFPLGLDLAGVTTLSDTAIEILAQKQAGHLRLGGLKSLSDKAAKSLSLNRSPVMVLDSVSTISDKAAALLAQHPGSLLSLGGLTTLSTQAAKALSSYEGDLYLDGLTALTPEVAKILAQHQGGLSLKGVATISSEVAEKLAQHRGALYLDGLKALPLDAAKAFAGHWGALSFNGLKTLSPEVAASLVQPEGELSLNGIATLTPEVATVLARHQGRLYLKGLKVNELPEEAKKALRRHRRIDLPDDLLSL